MVDQLTNTEIVIRIFCAWLASLIIGLERESHGRAAGLRTILIVGIAASIAMVLSERFYIDSFINMTGAAPRPDPARLAAGILSGIGFIGAGSIIRYGNRVQGVTTAAALWMTTILGLIFGAGQFFLGFLGLTISIIALFIIPRYEKLIKNDYYALLSARFHIDGCDENEFKNMIESQGVKIKRVELSYNLVKKQKIIVCDLKFKRDGLYALTDRVVKAAMTCPGIIAVEWKM